MPPEYVIGSFVIGLLLGLVIALLWMRAGKGVSC